MKNLFHKISSFVLIFSFVFALSGTLLPRNVYAAPKPTDTGTCFVAGVNQGKMTFSQCNAKNGLFNPDPTQAPTPTPASASINPFTLLKEFLLGVPGAIAIGILNIASLLTYLSGAILNFAVKYSVVDMKKNLDEIGAINDAWRTIRDICNMAFIFVLLYAAIQQILGVGRDVKGLIVRIVVVAVLINFSLFFTRFVIDISNLLALTLYDAIAPGALGETATTGLSGSMMQPLGLQSIWNVVSQGGLIGSKLLIIGVMGTIVTLVTAFVFFAVALMFIIRFVVLVFVLILSPVAFIASILPQAEQYRKQWLDALIAQAFFAPIYFLLTWITIVISRGIFKGGTGNMAEALAGGVDAAGVPIPPSAGAMGILMNFIIVIAMLIISLVVAKDWAGKTPGGVGKLTSWATGMAGSATLGVAGRFGRGTVGRAAQAVAENETLKNKAATSMFARLGLAASRKTAGASFDARSAGWAGQLGAGKGQSGGFAKDIKDKTKAEKEYADSLKPSDLFVNRKEKEFEAIKKTGTIAEVAAAQTKLDELKGASAEDLKNRKIKELVAGGRSKKDAKDAVGELETKRLRFVSNLRQLGNSEEQIKKIIETRSENKSRAEIENDMGWEFEAVKSDTNRRKEDYAKDKETSTTFNIPVINKPLSFTGRIGLVGPIKRERLEEALAIRKSTKEKKAAEKIAEEIGKQAEAAADDTGGAAPSAPVAPAAPAGPTP